MKVIYKWIKSKFTTTSKQLLWFITYAYVIQVGISMWIKTRYEVDLSPYLVYTTPVFAGTVGGYFTKAYQEKKLPSTVVQNNQPQQ